jgi:hypothetical protein
MDRTVERAIRQLEKKAAKAERLKERAATLLKEADDIETTKKPLFEALILKSAYAAGLDRLPFSAIVAGFETLRDASVATTTIDPPPSTRVDASGGLADDATIQLVVEIGRNTAPGRFAVLDQYLTWNGREGHWSGMVSPAVLAVFRSIFEPERLIVPNKADELVGEEHSNTSTEVFDNLATAVQPLDPPAMMSALTMEIHQRDPSNARDQIDEQPTTAANPAESTVPVTYVAPPAGEAIQGGSHAIPSSVGDHAAEPATTMGTSTTDAEPGAMATPSTPPEVPAQVLTRLPRSPFAGLRRRAGS